LLHLQQICSKTLLQVAAHLISAETNGATLKWLNSDQYFQLEQTGSGGSTAGRFLEGEANYRATDVEAMPLMIIARSQPRRIARAAMQKSDKN
jgi:hypothetical protein